MKGFVLSRAIIRTSLTEVGEKFIDGLFEKEIGNLEQGGLTSNQSGLSVFKTDLLP